MERTLGKLHQSSRSTTEATPSRQIPAGASYDFDPDSDGIAAIYAQRVIARGVDPRALCAEIRGHRQFGPGESPEFDARLVAARTTRFGRGTASPRQMVPTPVSSSPAIAMQPQRFGRTTATATGGLPRRLATAALIALLLIPFAVIAANGQEAPMQARYIVRAGDTLEAVAAEFGVDPASILAASAIQNPPYLSAGEIIIIPGQEENPAQAVATAQQRIGTSPFVVGAHGVAPGETLAKIAGDYGLDLWSLAAFNGVNDVDSLNVGQLLRIPLTDSVSEPMSPAPAAAEEAIGGASPDWVSSVAAPVLAQDVPSYQQMYSLSCEYAALFIATAAFGDGVPESAFMERIGSSDNPHWGYRGNIHGPWGGTDDYGIYPEALAPTLNEFGFVGDVFYGGGDPSSLTARLDAGMPVVTWLGYFGDTGWVQEDLGSYLLVPGMHVVTVYGYDDGGVYLANPGRGTYEYYGWDAFLGMWNVLDGMALGVAPM